MTPTQLVQQAELSQRSSPLQLWRTVARHLRHGTVTSTGGFDCWQYFDDSSALRITYRYPENTATLVYVDPTSQVTTNRTLRFAKVSRLLSRELRVFAHRRRGFVPEKFHYQLDDSGNAIPVDGFTATI